LHEPIFNTDFDSVQPTTYCGLKNWIGINFTPDVFSDNAFGYNSSLPTNQFQCKYVYPHSDSSCVGGVQYLKGLGPPCRELFEGKLVTSLIAGHSYKFSIWTQLFDTIYPNVGNAGKIVGINSFSAYFSQQLIQRGFVLNISIYTPQVQIWQMVTDTQHWVLLQDTFIAAGGEQYVSIGNFKIDAQIQTQLVDSIRNLPEGAYYFFDDASLIDITPNGVAEVGVRKLEVYPNPATQSIVISHQSLVNTIEVTDLLGRALKTITNIQSSITNIQVDELPSGIYFIKATDTNGNVMNSKFVKE
jgi:hypothetical protein